MVAIVAMVLGKEYVKVSRVALETGMVSFLGLGLTAQDGLVCMYLILLLAWVQMIPWS